MNAISRISTMNVLHVIGLDDSYLRYQEPTYNCFRYYQLCRCEWRSYRPDERTQTKLAQSILLSMLSLKLEIKLSSYQYAPL